MSGHKCVMLSILFSSSVLHDYKCVILSILFSPTRHLFAIGAGAYSRMIETNTNQCVTISGESGAGKTESTKLIMQYLAAVNSDQSNMTTEQVGSKNVTRSVLEFSIVSWGAKLPSLWELKVQLLQVEVQFSDIFKIRHSNLIWGTKNSIEDLHQLFKMNRS